jgi:hypothetical protein
MFVLTVLPWLLLVLGAILVLGVLPTALVVLAVYARGAVRTFAIGAIVPLVIGLLLSDAPSSSIVLAPVVSAVCGLVAIWLRREIRRRGWDRPDESQQ